MKNLERVLLVKLVLLRQLEVEDSSLRILSWNEHNRVMILKGHHLHLKKPRQTVGLNHLGYVFL